MNRNEVNEFFIDKDGMKIHAKLIFPKNSQKKLPVAIIVHGLTGNMEEGQIYGAQQACLDNGIAALRVELYGHGQSDGAFKNHTVTEWVEQIIYLVEYVKDWDFTDSIILAGHSQGGLAVMLAAGLQADNVKALLLMSPAICIINDCRRGVFFDAVYDVKNLPRQIRFWGNHDLGCNYLRTAPVLDIDRAIAAYDGPVMLVHGEADGAVPCLDTVEASKKYKNSRLAVIPEDGHCYENHLDKMVEAVSSFMKDLMSNQ